MKADVIVLGCTHYHWIKDSIIELVNGRAAVIEPSEAIGRRVKNLLNLKLRFLRRLQLPSLYAQNEQQDFRLWF